VASSVQAHNRTVEYSPPRLQRLGTLVELTQAEVEITGFEDAVDKWKITKINEKKALS
jgi:hypothetical protein